MPSIKDYKERLRLLENHIGSLRKQIADLLNENQLLKNELAESKENFTSTIDKLNKMDELLTEKSKEIAKLEEQAEGQVRSDNKATSSLKDQPVENFEIELGVDFDCANLDSFIEELESQKYKLVKGTGNKYICPIEPTCTFQADSSKMHEHTRKHTGERPFQCAICKTTFVTKSVTRRHIRGKHLDHITSLKFESMNAPESENPVHETANVLNADHRYSDQENSSSPSEKPPKTRYSLRRSNGKRKILEETTVVINSEKRMKTET